jgi:hypothetical protein
MQRGRAGGVPKHGKLVALPSGTTSPLAASRGVPLGRSVSAGVGGSDDEASVHHASRLGVSTAGPSVGGPSDLAMPLYFHQVLFRIGAALPGVCL